MCAKVLPSFTDENRDLQKQIGCMNGIFQLFDRHHFPRRRGISSQNQKRLLPGAHPNMDPRHGPKAVAEKDLKVAWKESRVSFESSRASCSSSSCSSMLSSFDSNKMAQTEAVSFLQNKLLEIRNQTTTTKEQNTSFATSQQSLDLRDVVKDSMYRETRSLSIKSKAKDESRGPVLKHIDSPRPPQQFKSGKLQEVTQYKDERLMLHRLSYDERDSRDALKSTIQRKELPRLSLDSRAGTMKRSNFLPRVLDMGNDNFTQVVPSNQEPGSNKRTSNVVAKLMGLEVSSDISDCESMPLRIKSCSIDSISRSPKPASIGKHTQDPRLHGVQQKDPPSPHLSEDYQKQGLKNMKPSVTTPNKASSVYGEIEKRVTELEFMNYGKDLKALKHLLEAMEKTRQRLENEKANLTETPKRSEPATMTMKSAKVIDEVRVSSPSPVPGRDASHLQKLRTRDSTHKLENSVHKHPGKDFTPRNNLKDPSLHMRSTDKKANWRTSEVKKTSKAPQCIKVESRATCGRSSAKVSPRLKPKKQAIDGQSHPTTPSSDSRMIRRQCSKPVIQTGSRNRKVHLKSSNVQHNHDQQSEYTGDTRYSSHQGDTASMMSETNTSLVSEIETEEFNMAQSIGMNTNQHQKPIRRNSAATLRENKITDEVVTIMPEQPSPVSVLDETFCRDDSPSPIKKISTAFRDYESPTSDDTEWHIDNINGLTDQERFHGNSHTKLDMDDIVHELRLLNPTAHEESLDQNVCMFKSPNWDLQYITKILQASGLLRDVISVPTVIQHRSSHHLINPDLFDVLEQTERNMKLDEVDDDNARSKFNQKIHRKIVFDTVNEILVRKFGSQAVFTLGRKKLIREELPKGVHSELNRLMRKQDCIHDDEDHGFTRISMDDMMHQSADWKEHNCEISALVLDIERLIFKDLVTEVVIGEVMGLHN